MLSDRSILPRYTAAAVILLAGCQATSPVPNAQQAASQRSGPAASSSPIQHVVIVIQENRSFNNFFATYPGADGTTTGAVVANSTCGISASGQIALSESPLVVKHDLNHSFQAYNTARDGGKMNAFDNILNADDVPECLAPYQYVKPSDIQPYWDMAEQYVLAEHMFSTQGSSSFTGHQDLIRGGTIVAPGQAMVDLPSCSGGTCRWGCDAPKGTHTSLITQGDVVEAGKGPFPCTSDFTSKYLTLRDLLDAKNVSWKYYVPTPCCNTNGKLFAAYDVEYTVRYGPEWGTNVTWPQTNIFTDISSGELPAVSWLIPVEPDSDHPGEPVDDGPSWVASVVNAIGESSYWNSSAIVVVWDDWGGLYDNLNPKQVGYGGLGERVPALIISPYARAGFISPTYYQFGSILKYVEDNWNLGSLGTSDAKSKSIINCFDYSQTPITFKPIASERSKEYFLHRKGHFGPPDTDM